MSKLVREKLDEQFEKGKDPYSKYKIGIKEQLKKKYEVEDINHAIILAQEEGEADDVRKAIIKGARVDNKYGDALTSAAEEGQLDIVKTIVETEPRIQAYKDTDQISNALISAVQGGNFDIVRYLVEEGFNIHAHHEFPLRVAAQYGHLEILKYLIKKGVDTSQDEIDGCVTLAASKGNLKTVKYLVEELGGDPEKGINVAYQRGHEKVLKYLRNKMDEENE